MEIDITGCLQAGDIINALIILVICFFVGVILTRLQTRKHKEKLDKYYEEKEAHD